MLHTEEEQIKMLSYTLIVLSLLLLHCWNNKKKSEGLISSGYMHGSPRYTDGFVSNNHVKGLVFGNQQTKKKSETLNMNELETYVVNRHPADVEKFNPHISGLRWESESFVTGFSDKEQFSTGGFDDDNIMQLRNQELLGDDILTPLKPDPSSACDDIPSTSSMQLLNTDATSHYTPRNITI